jgi:hypothetical protein
MLFNQFSSISFCSICVDEGKDREKTDRDKTYTMIFAKKPLFSAAWIVDFVFL